MDDFLLSITATRIDIFKKIHPRQLPALDLVKTSIIFHNPIIISTSGTKSSHYKGNSSLYLL